MLHLHRRHGSSKFFLAVSASLLLLCMAYIYIRDIPLPCEGPGGILPSFGLSKQPLTPPDQIDQLQKTQNDTLQSRIAKVTVAANALNGGLIHRAIQSHRVQNDMHGYQYFIAENQAVSELIEHDTKNRPKGAWTKPAFLLSVLVAELEKDEKDRLEWIFWFDADTVVLNPYTPLEIFTPPKSRRDLDSVHLLISANWDGLNSGAFALRVHPWSVSFVSAVLAYPIYETERQAQDRFRDQSAFQFLLEHHDSPLVKTPTGGRDHWVTIPMRWFNSLPFNNAFAKGGKWIYSANMTDDRFDNGTTDIFDDGNGREVKPWKVMQGDIAIHFAGATAGSKGVRDSWMGGWLDRAEAKEPQWANQTTQEVLRQETDRFWANEANKIAVARKKLHVGDTLETDKNGPQKDNGPPPPKAAVETKPAAEAPRATSLSAPPVEGHPVAAEANTVQSTLVTRVTKPTAEAAAPIAARDQHDPSRKSDV